SGPTGTADDEFRTIAIQDNGWRHAAEWPLPGLKRIRVVSPQTVNVSALRVNCKVIDFVVEHDPRPCGNNFRAEAGVDGLRARDRVAKTVNDTEVSRAALFCIKVIVAVKSGRMRFVRRHTRPNPVRIIFGR